MSNLVQISNCKGIDCVIKGFQSKLYSHVTELYNGVEYDCFPRIQKTRKKDEKGSIYYLPEFLDGIKEYSTDTLFSDKVDLTSYFLVSDKREIVDKGKIKTVVSLVFSGYPNRLITSDNKADESFLVDLYEFLTFLDMRWELKAIRTSVEEVYSEFGKQFVQYTDMSEKHLLRFDFEVKYENC